MSFQFYGDLTITVTISGTSVVM